MVKISLIILFIIFSANTFGQYDERKIILSPGVSYQSQPFFEINLMYSKLTKDPPPPSISGPRIGVEANFQSSRFIIAPKIGVEFSGLIFAFRGNLINYFDQHKCDLRILPEIGLSFLGAINLTYGYGFPILKYESNVISRSRVTLTFNLDFRLWSLL